MKLHPYATSQVNVRNFIKQTKMKAIFSRIPITQLGSKKDDLHNVAATTVHTKPKIVNPI